MAISYNVYGNDGQGGEVDYSTPIATTPDLSYRVPHLAGPGDYRFAVRAFDAGSGIEEANTDARVRLVLDEAGNDATARPNPVVGLSARTTAGGTCRVSWGYESKGQGGPPSSFQVSLTAGASPSLANPAATIAHLPGVAGYGCTLSGLPANTPCTVAVRAVGASSWLAGPTATVTITDFGTPLGDVDSLLAVPTA